jgi:hypothetical protein
MFDVSLSYEERTELVEGIDEDAPLVAALVAVLLAHAQRVEARPPARASDAEPWGLLGRWRQLHGAPGG